MKVNDLSSQISSVMVGNMQVAEMTVDNSPEFFEILSSSIYNKSPILAFIRETISNGWDAHIQAGIQTPLDITLSDDEVTFTDYGLGIPTDLPTFQNIYGNYGKGTKRDDVNMIGGFGLGCKSPLAYAQSFYVSSSHNGISANYCITKGTKETNGRFAIIKTFEGKQENSGLAVSVPVKSDDLNTLRTYIRGFVYLSDIPVKLNGELLPTANISFKEANFTIVDTIQLPTLEFMNVRIANVVYPFPVNTEDDEYNSLFRTVNTFFSNNTSYRQNVIIQGAPEKVTIHPSRESLVASSHTLEYLKVLLHTMVKEFKRQANIIQNLLVKVTKNKLSSLSKEDLIHSNYDVYPDLVEELKTLPYFDYTNIYACLLRYSIKNFTTSNTGCLQNYISKLVKEKFSDNLLITKLNLNNFPWWRGFTLNQYDESDENPHQFSIISSQYEQHLPNLTSKEIYSLYNSFDFKNKHMKNVCFLNHLRVKLTHVVKPLIVLSTNKRDCSEWVYRAKAQLNIPNPRPYITIYTPNKKESIDWLRNHINSLDFDFIDLTKDWSFKPQKRKVISTKQGPNSKESKQNTLIVRTDTKVYRLLDILSDDITAFDKDKATKATPIKNPKAIIQIERDSLVYSHKLSYNGIYNTIPLLTEFGLLKDVGVTFTSNATVKWHKRGIDIYGTYLCKCLIKLANQHKKEYLRYKNSKPVFNSSDGVYIRVVYETILKLCHRFNYNPAGIKPPLAKSKDLVNFIQLLNYVTRNHLHKLRKLDTGNVIESLSTETKTKDQSLKFVSMVDSTPLTHFLKSNYYLEELKECNEEAYNAVIRLYIKQLKKVKL